MRSHGAHVAWSTALAISLLLAQAPPVRARASPTPLLIQSLGTGALPIDGKWQFHLGDNPAWAAPAFDDSGWEQLSVDRPWGEQGHPGYHGFAWYRRSITLKADTQPAGPFSLLVPQVAQAYEIYWNGSLIGHCGSLPPRPVWFVQQGPHIFPLGSASAGVLAVRTWNAPPLSDEDPGLSGGFLVPPLIGTPAAVDSAKTAIDYAWLRSHLFLFSETLLYALVAVLSLLVWARNRDHWVLFWMCGFTLSSVLIVLLVESRVPLPYTVSMALDQPFWSLRDVSMWFLLLWLLDLQSHRELARLTRRLAVITMSVSILDGVLVAVAWHPRLEKLSQGADALITVVNTLTQLFPLVLVGSFIKRRKHLTLASSLVADSAFLVEMAIVLRNVSQQGLRFTHWSLRDAIDGPLWTLNGSSVSLMNLLQGLLFTSVVYAVYASFLDHRRREVQIEHELKHAQELQRVLVPDASVALPGFSLSSAYRPAQQVGGDFFQVIPLAMEGEFPVLIVIGDVSGKGLRAAMAVSFLVGALHALVAPDSRPAELLGEWNARLSGHLQDACATCLILRLEQDGRCAIASAGHPGPYIDGCELELPGALPLGILPETEYEEVRFALRPHQTCALYTDGLVEARNRAGQMFGFPRLASMFGRHPSAAQAADSAVYFGQTDDITVVILTTLSPQERIAPEHLTAQNADATLASEETALIR